MSWAAPPLRLSACRRLFSTSISADGLTGGWLHWDGWHELPQGTWSLDVTTETRSAKGRRTRARLLEAGKAVFERDGFLRARISDISAEAQVSHGSFYHYFDSKESLFQEI